MLDKDYKFYLLEEEELGEEEGKEAPLDPLAVEEDGEEKPEEVVEEGM